MHYHHLTKEERAIIANMRRYHHSYAEIARAINRHRSTISREYRRNIHANANHAYYTTEKAHEKAVARKNRSQRNRHFQGGEMGMVEERLAKKWSPEQISETLKREEVLSISHETIYQHVWRDKRRGGHLFQHLRQVTKKKRKRYGSYEKRGRVTWKRMIAERPPSVENREDLGHWEIDTVMGKGSKDCIVTMVERKSGYVEIGKLSARTSEEVNKKVIEMISSQPREVKTITSDNGTEFHDFLAIENATGATFYFANPHHSWERGTNENTNGLIRQYLPKGTSMHKITQERCNEIKRSLNERPRKRLGFKTPEMCYAL